MRSRLLYSFGSPKQDLEAVNTRNDSNAVVTPSQSDFSKLIFMRMFPDYLKMLSSYP
jgi:hypothetical protein